MTKYKTYRRGWYNESYRHSLARRGIKTSKRLNYTKKRKENDIKELLTQAQQEALESRKERIGFTKLSGGQVRLKSIPHGVYNISIVKLRRGVYSVFAHSKEIGIPSLGPTNIYGDIGDVKFYVRTRISKDGGKILYSKGINLEDPTKYKFGSVKWQDSMLYNISEKVKHGEELSPVEKTFLEVQEEHLSRINYQQISYQPTQITTPVPPPPDKEEIPEEHRRLEKGWIQRGLRKEAELGKKVISGVGKVGRGILGTIATGLAWEPEEQTNFAKKVKKIKVITKKEKKLYNELNSLTKDLVKLTKKIKKSR